MILFRFIPILSFLFLIGCAPKTQLPESSSNSIPSSGENRSIKSVPMNELQATKVDGRMATGNLRTPTDNKKFRISGNPAASSTSNINSFELSGAMAARSRNKGWSASINWVQRGANDYQISLSGPIGSGTMVIRRSGGTVIFREGAKTVSSSSAESLLAQQTGISLPVSYLFYWVRGTPAPGAVQGKRYDQSGNLIALRQAGYAIDYQGYASYGQKTLPSSIRLQGNGVFIKLLIKNWRF